MRTLIASLAVGLAMAACPSTAQSHAVHHRHHPVHHHHKAVAPAFPVTTTHALEIAQRAWGQCDGPITIDRIDEPDPTVLGRGAVGACLDGDPDNNVILVPLVFNADWDTYCSMIVHEDGHLHGFGHSSQGTSIMSPVLSHIWQDCLPKRQWINYPPDSLTTNREAPKL